MKFCYEFITVFYTKNSGNMGRSLFDFFEGKKELKREKTKITGN